MQYTQHILKIPTRFGTHLCYIYCITKCNCWKIYWFKCTFYLPLQTRNQTRYFFKKIPLLQPLKVSLRTKDTLQLTYSEPQVKIRFQEICTPACQKSAAVGPHSGVRWVGPMAFSAGLVALKSRKLPGDTSYQILTGHHSWLYHINDVLNPRSLNVIVK